MTFAEIAPWIGAAGAVLTTICWLPQAMRAIRLKDTSAISLTTNLVFAAGLVCWFTYGVALGDWPIMGANAISFVFTMVIIAMKLRYG
jgi:MtN3 and saliva related transmembrane protein